MGDLASMQAGTRVNVEQASKRATRKPTRLRCGEGRRRRGEMSDSRLDDSAGVVTSACMRRKSSGTREAPAVGRRAAQPGPRERQAGPLGVAERPVVLTKPGNAGGGKGPWVRVSVGGVRVRRVA